MKRNFITKYFLWAAISILLCLTILGGALMLFVLNNWKQEKTDLLYENVVQISDITEKYIINGELKLDKEQSMMLVCADLSAISRIVNADIFICDSNGKIVMCKDMISENGFSPKVCDKHSSYEMPDNVLKKTKKDGEFVEVSKVKSESGVKRYFIIGKSMSRKIPIGRNSDATVEWYVFASESINENLKPYITEILKMFILSALVAMFIAFIVIYVLVFKYTKPLRDMVTATHKYAEGDFSYRVEIKSSNELSYLANAFNEMAGKLATLEDSRRSFVANVSHELKTPMTTIGGFIDGILDGTIPKDKQDYYLKRVSGEVKRLSRLVVEMLNMSKIEAGELKLTKTRFDIAEQIFNVLLLFEQKIDEKHIAIEGISSMHGIYVEADKDMIHQVLFNLIDNAVKFTQDGGTIDISAASGEGKVVISIKNTGEGISPEDLNNIFERFYKVDKSRSLDVKGTGLGLYLVKSIIELHSGKIKAISEVGKYTEMVFWLPAEK